MPLAWQVIDPTTRGPWTPSLMCKTKHNCLEETLRNVAGLGAFQMVWEEDGKWGAIKFAGISSFSAKGTCI